MGSLNTRICLLVELNSDIGFKYLCGHLQSNLDFSYFSVIFYLNCTS